MPLPDISDKNLIKGLEETTERDSDKPINFDKLTGEEKIELIRNVVRRHQYQKVKSEGHVQPIDAQTANAIITVYDALNDENKKKFASLSYHTMGNIAWKLVT